MRDQSTIGLVARIRIRDLVAHGLEEAKKGREPAAAPAATEEGEEAEKAGEG